MTFSTRADLDAIPAYVAGRTVPGAVKLASNEVSAGPLPSVREAIAQAATAINRYPDTAATALTRRLAERFAVPAEQLVTGCGSVSLLQMLVQATCTSAEAVLYGWRSFEAYPIQVQVVGAQAIAVPITADHALDTEAMLAAITPRTRLVLLCSPNNPTGTVLRSAELRHFVDNAPEDVLIVLDEAYREFVTDPDVPDGIEFAKEMWARGRQNIAVLRTFSKAYGLAGLRVGYCAAPLPIAEALRKVAIPFAVNHLAQIAAIASLDAEAELMQRCARIVEERTRVRNTLLELGFQVPPSEANFVWLPLGAETARFNEHCMDHNVIVRAFANDGARVTIGEPHENDTFLAAAQSFTKL